MEGVLGPVVAALLSDEADDRLPYRIHMWVNKTKESSLCCDLFGAPSAGRFPMWGGLPFGGALTTGAAVVSL